MKNVSDLDAWSMKVWDMIKDMEDKRFIIKDGLCIEYIDGKHHYRFKDSKGTAYKITIEKM